MANGAPGGPTMEWVQITVEMAKALLGDNHVNRRLRKHVVVRYAEDMLAGRWRGADSMIIRRADGQLLDGQHRLGAVVLAGMPLWTWLQTVDESVAPMDLRADTGITRSAPDILGVTTMQAGVARVLHYMATKKIGPSIDVVSAVIETVMPDLDRLTRTTRRGFTTAPVVAAVCYSLHAYPGDAEEIARQYHSLAAEQNDVSIWPGFYSAARQTLESSFRGRASNTEVFLRVARGLGDARYKSKIQFKDIEIYRAKIEPLIREYIGLGE